LVGHYRIVGVIGRGGLGEVLAADDLILGRRVALKFLKAERDAHAQVLEEARAAARLDHPYVCSVFETGEFLGRPFIAMEFLEGETLGSRLKSGRIPLQKTVVLAAEIGEALAAAHGKGIVHCDLKPSNIMITASGHVKLMDFGLACIVRSAIAASQDETNTMFAGANLAGTPAYMAPEQIRGDMPDMRSDVFAFGIVFSEMLTGVHPFRARTLAATVAATVHDDAPDIAHYVPEANSLLRQILRKTLAKNSADRYPSAGELVADLNRLREGGDLESGGAAAARPVLAILPFRDLSAQRDQEYFCDGLAEELILALGRIERLRVVSRSAAFRYRDSSVGLREIGKALGATSVLEGSVRKAGNRVRVVVNLVNPEDDCSVWSERYDRALDDIFEIQDDIAAGISEKLSAALALPETRRAARAGHTNIRAYELYLQGRYLWNKRTEDDLKQSIERFRQALAEDPNYALAHAAIADAWVTLALYGAVCPLDALPAATEAADRALALEPLLSEALTSRACIRAIFERDWRSATREFEAAIALNPRYAQARQWFAMNCLLPQGEFDRAREELKCASQLEPISLAIAASVGILDFYRGDYDEAVRHLQAVLDLDGRFYLAHYFLGQTYCAKGINEDAIRELKIAFESGGSSESLSALGYAQAIAGDREKADDVLRQLLERTALRYVSPLLIAQVQVGLGQMDAAVKSIEDARRVCATDLIWFNLRPAFRHIRSYDRVPEILSRAGIF
jgi:TolB-like protein/Flp pilus assembly protein TadD